MKKLLGALALLTPHAALATEADENEIIVTAVLSEKRVAADQFVLDSHAIDEKQPSVVADILRGISGISLRQNSRGETVVRVRSGEERQTPIFLDGAPLTTPWDGRVDLGLLPSGVIRSVFVTQSAAPIEYGANAIAGVIDLGTQPPIDTALIRAEITGGSGNFFGASGLIVRPIGDSSSLTVAGTYSEKEFDRIADRSAVPFDSSSNRRRSNSDQSATSVFGAFAHEASIGEFRISFLHVDAKRGIGAEGHVDPLIDRPRYWRYPRWRLTQANISTELDITNNLYLRTVAWAQWFSQDIDSFTDDSYSVLEERESGRDKTFGGRLTLNQDIGASVLRFSASASRSTHRQTIFESPAGTVSDLKLTDRQIYRQNLLSIGAEADIPLGQNLKATIGSSFDRSETPFTGDKPAQNTLTAPGFFVAAAWEPADTLSFKASLAQRTRFPTMREFFGQALGRFLINPDIGPERARMADVTAKWRPLDAFSANVTFWINDSNDTLGQRRVRVNGSSLRQRFNMLGSFTYGVETSFNARLTDNLTAELSAAFQAGKPKFEPGTNDERLVQQVNRQVNIALDWAPIPQLDLRAEYNHIGRAYDLDENNIFVSLPTSNVFNLRAFWKVHEYSAGRSMIMSLALENVSDELMLPQLGLPSPGRSVRVGLKIEL